MKNTNVQVGNKINSLNIAGVPERGYIMKKFTYWKSKCLHDSDCYSIRAKTKKEVLTRLQAMKDGGHYSNVDKNYGKPQKVFVEYQDISTLIFDAQCEGGLYENGED